MNITLNNVDFRYELDGPEGAPWIVFSNSLSPMCSHISAHSTGVSGMPEI